MPEPLAILNNVKSSGCVWDGMVIVVYVLYIDADFQIGEGEDM